MSSKPVLGMYRASVANNSDPLNEVRVTLLIPQILGTAESAWAVPAAPTNTVPQVGQVVWVQFSGGDITKPVYSPLGLKDLQDQVEGGLSDSLPPKEPAALTLTTVQYAGSEGVTQARVTASWTVPTENQDGTALTDLSHYVLQYSYDGANWSGGQVTQDNLVILDGLHTGVNFFVRVQSVDNSSNTSLWAAGNLYTASSTTPPPIPSTPIVLGVLGGLRVLWDGRDSTGAAMPVILSHVQVQRDTNVNFTNPVVVGSLPGADTFYDSVQNYATAYNYRLVAYSRVGVASAPSVSASAVPKQAGVGDLAVNSVVSNLLTTGRITAQDGVIESLDAGTIKVGTLNVERLSAGLQATIGQKFYDFGTDASKWKNGNSTGQMTTVASNSAASGGFVMRCVGPIQGAYRPDLLIPFDPGLTYRVTARVRQTVANVTPDTAQRTYIGVTGIAADGVTLVNVSGVNTTSSQAFVAARATPLTVDAGWQTFTGYVKGIAATGASGPNNSPTDPAVLNQNVKYISPCLHLNNSGGTGTAELDVFTIEVVETGAVGTPNILLGAVKAESLDADVFTGRIFTGGTVTGATVQTALAGKRLVMAPDGTFYMYAGRAGGETAGELSTGIDIDGEMEAGYLTLKPPTHGPTAPEITMAVGPLGEQRWSMGPLRLLVENSTEYATVTGKLTVTGDSDIFGKLTAGNIKTGSVTIMPVIDTPTAITVTGIGLSGTPMAFVTANTQDPYTRVRGVSVSGVSANAMTIWVTRTTATATLIYWMLVGS